MPRRRRPWTKKRKLRQEGLFSIKSILGERLVDGNVQYLLNWEDDPETGEVYDNTWVSFSLPSPTATWRITCRQPRFRANVSPISQEPAEFVTAPAIAEWEAQKPPASSEDSQPPRPANWRQLQRAQSNNRERSQEQVREPSSSLPELPGRDEEPARKKRRLDFATSPSQEPVPSITSSTSFPSATSDIPEDIQPPRTEASRLFVQLRQVPDSFAADYQSVADTQSTPYSSQTIGELEARDERIALVEDSSQKTIPDSQETSNPDLIEDYNQATAQSVRTPPPDVAPDFQSRTCEQSKPDEAVDSQPESSTSSAPKEPIPDEAFDSQPQSLVLPETAASSTSGASEEAASDEAINSESQSLVVPPETFENSTSSASKEVVLDETLNSQSQSLVPPETSEDSTFTAPEDFVPDEALDSQPQSLVRPETVENSASSAPEEVVPDSADVHPDDVNTDIPSRQPNQLDFHDHPGQELAEVTRSEGEQVDKAATNNNDSQEVSQPVFLTQPNFQEPNLGSSSSQAQFQTPVATRSERPISSEQPETKYNPPRRALPEYSPGILISLCQESDDAMFGTERDEEPRSRDRPSLLAEVRALWDDEPSIPIQPAEQKRSSPSHPALQPESMPLASSYHTVAGASPSQHRQPDFLSRPPVETQSWTAGLTDMSGPGSRPVASSESASEMMQKLLADTIAEPQPTTVSPADVSLPTEVERLTIPVYSSHEAVVPGLYGSSGNSIALGQVSEADKGVTPKSSSDLEELDSHMVTLPLQASLRNLYDEILLKHKYEVTQFGDAFSTEVFTEPDQSLTSTIDSLFSQFHNLCDYPPNALESPLEGVPTAQKVRYYMDSNAKLHFLYEFLHGITQDTAILIVARSPNLLRLMCEVAEALKLDCTCASLGYHAANTESFVRLTLSLSSNNDEEPDSRQYDVIIGYDGPSSNSAKFRSLAQSAEKQSALVLNLIAAFSIEHIETEMPPVKTEMERKNALLIGIVNARSLIIDPPSLPKPPDVGRLFASYVNDRTKTIVWEPEPIPASVLDFYMNSQSLSQMPREKSLDSEGGGLKRKLVSSYCKHNLHLPHIANPDRTRMRTLKAREYDSVIETACLPTIYHLYRIQFKVFSLRLAINTIIPS